MNKIMFVSDLDDLRITRRYRSPSPVLARSPLRDRILDKTEADLIKARVDVAIEKNKTREAQARLDRERLDRLEDIERIERINDWTYRYPYSVSTCILYFKTLHGVSDPVKDRFGVYIFLAVARSLQQLVPVHVARP